MHRTRTVAVGIAALVVTTGAGAAVAAPAGAAPGRSTAASSKPLQAFRQAELAARTGRHATVVRTAASAPTTSDTPAVTARAVAPTTTPYVAYGGASGSGLTVLATKVRQAAAIGTVPNPYELVAAPTGSRVASDYTDGTQTAGIAVTTVATGGVRRLTSNPAGGSTFDLNPALSPDDQTVAFAHVAPSSSTQDTTTIETVPASGGAPTTLVTLATTGSNEAAIPTTTLAYAGDGTLLYSDDDATCAIFRYTAGASTPTSCVLTHSALVSLAGANAEVAALGWGGGTASIPFEVTWPGAESADGDSETFNTQIGELTGTTARLFSSTHAISSVTVSSDGQSAVAHLDVSSSPTLDPTGTEVVYERDVSVVHATFAGASTITPSSSAAYSVDTATGLHRAKVANTAFGPGVAASWPESGGGELSSFDALATPQRILDTRTSTGGHAGALTSSAPFDLQVTGAGGVPSGATAVVLNLTAIAPTRNAFVQVYPTPTSGSAVPTVSSIDLRAGQVLPNDVTVALPASGKLRLRVSDGAVNLAVDVTGYYEGGTDGALFTPTAAPTRVIDTRSGTGVRKGALGPNSSVDVAISGVPADATSVVLELGGIEHGSSGFVTAYPRPASGTARPTTSTLDLAGVGTTLENLTTVGLGSGQKIRIYNSANTADVFADLVGWYVPSSSSSSGSVFVPLSPTRALDTRDGTNTVNGAVAPIGQGVAIDARGTGELTTAYGDVDVPTDASAVIGNLTAIGASATTYLTLYAPTSAARPNASTIDVPAGATLANAAITAPGLGQQVRLFNATGHVDAAFDVAGWFAPYDSF